MYAYYSLGRISIFKAAESNGHEELEKRLKEAIGYFEKSAKEPTWHKPAEFCLPFYRSYVAITFKGKNKKEIEKYLKKANDAVGKSKSKGELFKAVENLAKVLCCISLYSIN